jgi:hypothetical protein
VVNRHSDAYRGEVTKKHKKNKKKKKVSKIELPRVCLAVNSIALYTFVCYFHCIIYICLFCTSTFGAAFRFPKLSSKP